MIDMLAVPCRQSMECHSHFAVSLKVEKQTHTYIVTYQAFLTLLWQTSLYPEAYSDWPFSLSAATVVAFSNVVYADIYCFLFGPVGIYLHGE